MIRKEVKLMNIYTKTLAIVYVLDFIIAHPFSVVKNVIAKVTISQPMPCITFMDEFLDG